MNWVTVGKWLAVLATLITQVAVPLCNGQALTVAAISAVLAALIAAGIIHTGQVQDDKLLAQHGMDLGYLRKAQRKG